MKRLQCDVCKVIIPKGQESLAHVQGPATVGRNTGYHTIIMDLCQHCPNLVGAVLGLNT